MALIMIPNRYFDGFGKVVFILCDVYIVKIIKDVLLGDEFNADGSKVVTEMSEKSFEQKQKNENALLWCWIWALNPMSAIICTRGSADSISNALLLVLVKLVLERDEKEREGVPDGDDDNDNDDTQVDTDASEDQDQKVIFPNNRRIKRINELYTGSANSNSISAGYFSKVARAGMVYGLLVHFRLYPIIYAPAFVVYYYKRYTMGIAQDFVDRYGNVDGKKKEISVSRLFHETSTSAPVKFVFVASCTYLYFGVLSYIACGQEFWDEGVLYHLYRKDHRHNFSLHCYDTYLQLSMALLKSLSLDESAGDGDGESVSLSRFWATTQSLLRLLPQALLLVGVALKMKIKAGAGSSKGKGTKLDREKRKGRKVMVQEQEQTEIETGLTLPVALLLSTVIFVAYNSVITAQYFTWSLCLVPLSFSLTETESPANAIISPDTDMDKVEYHNNDKNKGTELPSLLFQKMRLFGTERGSGVVGVKIAGLAGGMTVGLAYAQWLHHAYNLEMGGEHTYMDMFQWAIVFHVAQCVCVAILLYHV